MENTNDKTAVQRWALDLNQHHMYRDATGQFVRHADHVAALEARAEEARREAQEEHKQFRCLVKSMAEACRSAQAERNALRIQLDQRTAGGDIDNDEFWALVIAYCRGVGREGAALVDYVQRWGDSKVREALRFPEDALRKNGFTKIDDVWVPPPVAEAAAQADEFCDGNCTWRDHAPGCQRAAPTAQPTPPDDERETFDRAWPAIHAHGGARGWRGVAEAAWQAALRQPGAPAKPLTRRDINFVKQPPGVIALTLAILWHDGAERPLYTRDHQIAWTGVDAGGHEKSVTVGQLREVLVAALGLPVGTKFGG